MSITQKHKETIMRSTETAIVSSVVAVYPDRAAAEGAVRQLHEAGFDLGDLLVVRLQGVLTAAEKQLVKTLPAEKGRDLLKQVRTHLIETARPLLEAMIQEVTGVKPLSLHHDISTVTGEEIVIFTLAESPLLRETKKK